jgi:hypothetical protein
MAGGRWDMPSLVLRILRIVLSVILFFVIIDSHFLFISVSLFNTGGRHVLFCREFAPMAKLGNCKVIMAKQTRQTKTILSVVRWVKKRDSITIAYKSS